MKLPPFAQRAFPLSRGVPAAHRPLVKALFKEVGIVPDGDEMAVVELDISSDGPEVQAALLALTKQRTVPNVWIKGRHIGGFDDTNDLATSGELQTLLGLPVSSPTRPEKVKDVAAAKAGGPAFHVAYGAS